MKKIILILFGIAIILSGVIYVLYQNSKTDDDEVETIIKEEIDPPKEEPSSEKEKDTVIVDIKGMIKNPGVYTVPVGSRVNDVISVAGGLLEGADTSLINLAKIVSDEMTIIIYSSEEVQDKYREEICVCDCPEITNDACLNTDEEERLINLNTASKEELQEVPGIGEAKAEEIIKYRNQNGPFKSLDDIKNVAGIGESLFEKIKDYLII